MDDDGLDTLLRRADPAPRTETRSSALETLVSETRGAARPRRIGQRKRAGIGFGVLSALLVGTAVAGTTTQDWRLSIPPFAGLDEDEQRTSNYIRLVPPVVEGVDPAQSDGGEHCALYPEFRGLSADQLGDVEHFIDTHPLATLSDDALAAAKQTGKTGDELANEWSDQLVAQLAVRLRAAVPALESRVGATAGHPVVVGYTYTCRDEW